MKKIVTFILVVLVCMCGYAQTIDPVLLEKMNQRGDNEKIKVFVIMRQQLDQQQLSRRAAHFTTRADRREFVVNELKQFAEASQYDLRHSLAEMQRNELVSEPKTLWIANAIYFEATKDAILSLANRSDIMVIGFDEESNWLPDGEEARPAYPTREITSNVTQVNADQVWSLGYTGQGVVVAVIDTGVNYNHLDLADHLWDGGPDFPYHGFDVYNDDNNPMDDHGHGTHCAGTVCGDGTAGSQTGMAPDATLMIVKCLGAGGSGTNTQVMSAMQWAVDHGCDVISMSLGGHGHSGAAQTLERNTCVNVLNAGVIAAIAAGNEGNKMGQYPIPDNIGLPGGCPPPYLDPEQEQNPGGLSCSVCVGAVDSNDQATSFTSHGPRDWSESDYADYPYTPGSQTEFGLIRPDVCAPGSYIKSADYSGNNGYTTMSGTSMATPCVAGCMALILSKDIETTPADVCRILEETAVPLSTGKSNIYGYGRVDVLAAINAMYSGPLRLDSFTVNDGQGNNDGNLNAGEAVSLNLTLTNGSDLALDGATMVLSSQSEYVTITSGTSTLPHFGVGQTRTINNMFSFNLSNDAPAKRMVQFMAEIYVNGESVGAFRFGILVYGHILRFVEVTVSNDSNGDGMLEPGESANLHVTVLNAGNELASSVVGNLSTTYPYLVINSNNKSFGTIEVNGQASADFNVSLTGNAPTIYTIGCSLDLVDANQKHTNVDFELWRKAITLTSNPEGGGTLSGGGYYGQGQSCTISASANPGYAFEKWTMDGTAFSYLPTYTFDVTGEAEYVANFQAVTNGVVIGDGAGTHDCLPSYSYYCYTLSQQIYTANELNLGACDISNVSFFNAGTSKTRNFTVYMVNTSKTAFDSNTDWITVTDADKVFSGSVSLSHGSWTTIYFDTPFSYDGSSNVALIVDDNTGNWYYNNMSCRVSSTDNCQALCVYSDMANFDPNSPNNYTGTQLMVKNQVIFGVASYDYSVTVSANPSNEGTVSGGGLYYYNQQATLTATANEGYMFSNWTKNGEVVSYVSQYPVSVTESAEYVANFELAPEGIVIGDATYTNVYLPSYSVYNYTLSQQIYTAAEMGGEPCQISSVSFFNTGNARTRNYTIYLVNTTKTTFESNTDWITVTEADQVFNGSFAMNTGCWTTIYFNTVFSYDGVSNLALIVDDNTGSWNSAMSCRSFPTEDNQSIYVYSDGTNYDPYNPSGYTGVCPMMKNQVIFGIPSFDYTVTVSASPAEGGSVSGGGPCYLNQPITITATANPGYVFSNWTKNGEVVSYVSKCTMSITESTEYVANFELAPDGIVIGDGTYTNAYLPTYYYYSLSEQIYTASEMGGVATEISSVSFFNTGSSNRTRNMNIYMVNTDKTSFESSTDWIPVSENDLVFSGNVTITSRSWVTIYFNTPFNYDGSSNVALIVDDNSNNYNVFTSCRTFDTETSQAIRIAGSETNYDPYAPTDYTGTLMSVKNQVIFGIPSYDYMVTVTANPGEGGSVSGGGQCYLNQPITLTATPNEGYVFSNWTKDGEVVSYLSYYSLSVTESAEYVANFQEVTNGFVVGDATYTNAILPTYYYYSLTEQIYTANEMGGTATEISSVSFFNTGSYSITRNMSVYMLNTNKTSFEGTSDWIPVSDDYLVFSGNVTFTARDWVTVYFSTPFNYDGSSNVALIVDDNSNSYNTYISCRTFSADGNQTLRIYGSGTNYDPYNPTDFTGTLMSEKNQVIFRWPSVITATANLSQGGTISGAGSYAYGTTCTLTATPNAGYYFLNWTEDGEVVSYDGTYSFTIEGNRNLVANFVEGGSTCMIAFDLYDSYGDGWNGNYLVVDFGNGTSEQFTIQSGSSASYSRVMDTDSHITLTWISGSYIGECSFDVRFDNGVQIFHKSGLSASFQQELTINCALATAPHTITAVANPEEGGTVIGAGTYDGGTVITMTATPNDGYTFCYWEENGQQVSTDAEYTFTVTADRNLVARFSLPLTISVTSNMPEGGTTNNGGMFYYGNTCTLTATPNNGYLFQNWSKNGEVVSCNATYNFTVTESAEIEAVFMLLEGTLVGQGETTNQNLPSYSYYNYTLSQQIYTMQEIGEAGNITSISFYNGGTTKTRKFDIYLVHTDKTAFESATDWITVTEADRVYSGDVNMTQGYWTTLVLDTPFAYNGTSNLAVIVDDNMGSWSSGMACRVFNANGYQAIRVCSDNTNYDPFNPSEYNGARYTVKNQIIFGLSSTCHFITAGNWSEASNWSGGTVPEANDEVFIDASCQLDMDATVASLAVSNGHSLTLQSGQTLTVTNTLTNAATTGLIIEDGAQLVHASENVSAMVKKNIAGHGTSNGRYCLISNPLTTVVDPEMSSVYHLITGDYDLYDWLPSAPDSLEWRNYKTNDFMMSPDGYGYLYANRNDVELNFPGILKPSYNRYAKSVSYDSNDIEHLGWNLIGNPFVCNAYLVDEEGTPLPYYRMNASGNGIEAVAPGTPIAPMGGVFYVSSESGTVYFTRIAPSEAADKAVKRTVKQINDNIEHSTLGDLEVLAGLKENLEKQEKAQQGE